MAAGMGGENKELPSGRKQEVDKVNGASSVSSNTNNLPFTNLAGALALLNDKKKAEQLEEKTLRAIVKEFPIPEVTSAISRNPSLRGKLKQSYVGLHGFERNLFSLVAAHQALQISDVKYEKPVEYKQEQHPINPNLFAAIDANTDAINKAADEKTLEALRQKRIEFLEAVRQANAKALAILAALQSGTQAEKQAVLAYFLCPAPNGLTVEQCRQNAKDLMTLAPAYCELLTVQHIEGMFIACGAAQNDTTAVIEYLVRNNKRNLVQQSMRQSSSYLPPEVYDIYYRSFPTQLPIDLRALGSVQQRVDFLQAKPNRDWVSGDCLLHAVAGVAKDAKSAEEKQALVTYLGNKDGAEKPVRKLRAAIAGKVNANTKLSAADNQLLLDVLGNSAVCARLKLNKEGEVNLANWVIKSGYDRRVCLAIAVDKTLYRRVANSDQTLAADIKSRSRLLAAAETIYKGRDNYSALSWFYTNRKSRKYFNDYIDQHIQDEKLAIDQAICMLAVTNPDWWEVIVEDRNNDEALGKLKTVSPFFKAKIEIRSIVDVALKEPAYFADFVTEKADKDGFIRGEVLAQANGGELALLAKEYPAWLGNIINILACDVNKRTDFFAQKVNEDLCIRLYNKLATDYVSTRDQNKVAIGRQLLEHLCKKLGAARVLELVESYPLLQETQYFRENVSVVQLARALILDEKLDHKADSSVSIKLNADSSGAKKNFVAALFQKKAAALIDDLPDAEELNSLLKEDSQVRNVFKEVFIARLPLLLNPARVVKLFGIDNKDVRSCLVTSLVNNTQDIRSQFLEKQNAGELVALWNMASASDNYSSLRYALIEDVAVSPEKANDLIASCPGLVIAACIQNPALLNQNQPNIEKFFLDAQQFVHVLPAEPNPLAVLKAPLVSKLLTTHQDVAIKFAQSDLPELKEFTIDLIVNNQSLKGHLADRVSREADLLSLITVVCAKDPGFLDDARVKALFVDRNIAEQRLPLLLDHKPEIPALKAKVQQLIAAEKPLAITLAGSEIASLRAVVLAVCTAQAKPDEPKQVASFDLFLELLTVPRFIKENSGFVCETIDNNRGVFKQRLEYLQLKNLLGLENSDITNFIFSSPELCDRLVTSGYEFNKKQIELLFAKQTAYCEADEKAEGNKGMPAAKLVELVGTLQTNPTQLAAAALPQRAADTKDIKAEVGSSSAANDEKLLDTVFGNGKLCAKLARAESSDSLLKQHAARMFRGFADKPDNIFLNDKKLKGYIQQQFDRLNTTDSKNEDTLIKLFGFDADTPLKDSIFYKYRPHEFLKLLLSQNNKAVLARMLKSNNETEFQTVVEELNSDNLTQMLNNATPDTVLLKAMLENKVFFAELIKHSAPVSLVLDLLEKNPIALSDEQQKQLLQARTKELVARRKDNKEFVAGIEKSQSETRANLRAKFPNAPLGDVILIEVDKLFREEKLNDQKVVLNRITDDISSLEQQVQANPQYGLLVALAELNETAAKQVQSPLVYLQTARDYYRLALLKLNVTASQVTVSDEKNKDSKADASVKVTAVTFLQEKLAELQKAINVIEQQQQAAAPVPSSTPVVSAAANVAPDAPIPDAPPVGGVPEAPAMDATPEAPPAAPDAPEAPEASIASAPAAVASVASKSKANENSVAPNNSSGNFLDELKLKGKKLNKTVVDNKKDNEQPEDTKQPAANRSVLFDTIRKGGIKLNSVANRKLAEKAPGTKNKKSDKPQGGLQALLVGAMSKLRKSVEDDDDNNESFDNGSDPIPSANNLKPDVGVATAPAAANATASASQPPAAAPVTKPAPTGGSTSSATVSAVASTQVTAVAQSAAAAPQKQPSASAVSVGGATAKANDFHEQRKRLAAAADAARLQKKDNKNIETEAQKKQREMAEKRAGKNKDAKLTSAALSDVRVTVRLGGGKPPAPATQLQSPMPPVTSSPIVGVAAAVTAAASPAPTTPAAASVQQQQASAAPPSAVAATPAAPALR
jgi:hypothetical protein